MEGDHPDSTAEIDNTHNHDTQVVPEKKKGLALLMYDLKQRKLIPVKLLSLIVFSGYGVLLPFFAIHMKSLGVSVEETGAIYGVSSVIGVLTPLGTGMVADKLGNFKVLLSLSFGLASISALLFLLIPVGRMSVDYPMNSSFTVNCDDNSNLTDGSSIVGSLELNGCEFKVRDDLQSDITNVSVVLNECGYLCHGSNEFYVGSDAESDIRAEIQANSTKLTGETIFFPSDFILNGWCSQQAPGEAICEGDRQTGTLLNATLGIDFSSNIGNTSRRVPVNWISLDENGERMPTNFQCDEEGHKLHQTVYIKDLNDNDQNSYKFCRPQCIVWLNRSELCSNMVREEVFNPQLTFWLYMSFRCIFEVFLGASATLFEGAVLALVSEVRGDYGFQKVFGLIGIAVFSPISGVLIDHVSLDESNPDFRPAYFLFSGLFGIAALGMLTIDLKFKPPAENVIKDVKALLRNVELDALLVVVLILGILVGCTGNYLFLFLQEIGVTKSVMGLSIMVSCVTAIPLLLLSDTIFRKFSYHNVIVFGFSSFIIRFVGYSYISDPNLCLVYESIEAITGTLTVTSIITYGARLGTTSTVASIQGLLSATYFGLGAGTGSSIGGFLIGAYGQRVTFRILSAIAFITGFVYFLFNIFYLRRRNTNAVKNDSTKVH